MTPIPRFSSTPAEFAFFRSLGWRQAEPFYILPHSFNRILMAPVHSKPLTPDSLLSLSVADFEDFYPLFAEASFRHVFPRRRYAPPARVSTLGLNLDIQI